MVTTNNKEMTCYDLLVTNFDMSTGGHKKSLAQFLLFMFELEITWSAWTKMADSEKVTVSCHKSTSASKTIWTEEEKEHLTSLWSGEDLLFNCQNKDYFKKEQDTTMADMVLMSATFVTLFASFQAVLRDNRACVDGQKSCNKQSRLR